MALGAAVLARPAGAQVARCGGPSATVWSASGEAEARLVSLSNSFRRQQGLSALTVHSGLTAEAREWAVVMAREGRIRHSDLTVGVTANSLGAAENVGCDESVDGQHQAFLSSPVHRENLAEPAYTHIGVGLAYRPDGQLYTAEVFMAVAGAGSAASHPAPAPAASAPSLRPGAGTAPGPSAVARSSAKPARPSADTAASAGAHPRLVESVGTGFSPDWVSRLRGLDPSASLLRVLRVLLQDVLGALGLPGIAGVP